LCGGDLTVKALAAFAGRSRDKIKFRANLRRNQRMGKMIGIGETEHQKSFDKFPGWERRIKKPTRGPPIHKELTRNAENINK